MSSARSIFVTGATGVIGSELVRELLRRGCHVRALVRASCRGEAQRRLLDVLGAEVDETQKARLLVFAGDVQRPRLGLAADDYDRLSASVDGIVHGAATLKLERPRVEAVFEDVLATRTVLAFAERARRHGRLRKVDLVSTVGVGGRATSPLREAFVREPRRFHNSYEEAKAASEGRARVALERGLPITIHRPSMVVGHSRTGAVARPQIFYAIAEFLAGLRTGGLLPTLGPRSLDLVPVDHVARGIAEAVMDDGATVGRVLHHASGPRGAIGLAALSRAVRGIYAERGVELPPLRFVNPLAVACGALVLGRVLPEDVARRFAPVRPLLRYLATDQSFDTTSTEAWRARAGLELPPPSAYLDVVLRRHLEVTERRNRARQARRAA